MCARFVHHKQKALAAAWLIAFALPQYASAQSTPPANTLAR
jgi:hypothetical protein